MSRYVTVAEAARLMGRSRRTIYKWLEAGTVEAVSLPSGKVAIVADSLIKPLDQAHSRMARRGAAKQQAEPETGTP